jgi:hypothetical protein
MENGGVGDSRLRRSRSWLDASSAEKTYREQCAREKEVRMVFSRKIGFEARFEYFPLVKKGIRTTVRMGFSPPASYSSLPYQDASRALPGRAPRPFGTPCGRGASVATALGTRVPNMCDGDLMSPRTRCRLAQEVASADDDLGS